MLRILLVSDAIWASSGYSNQVRLLAPRLAQHCDLALLATYGLHGAPIEWGGLKVYPGGLDPFGNDVIGASARDWQADIVITLKDTPVFRPEAMAGLRWLPMTPVDHDPLPPPIAGLLRACYRPIAYAPHGFRAMRAAGFDPLYAPHAYDPAVFNPQPKGDARRALGLPDDLFLVGMVAVNRGGTPSRKAWPQNIEAFAQFAKDKPNARLFLHTHLGADGAEGAVNLPALVAQLGIADKVLYCDQERYKASFPEGYLHAFYNAIDVLNAVSLGEGFGIPTLEAQACFPAHVPVSAGDVSRASMKMYTGEIITITTERGSVIEVTSEHPFWTEQGWVAAKDLDLECRLLYTGEYEKELNNLHTGRIGDVAAALCDDAAQRVGATTRSNGWLGQLATASYGIKEILCEPDRIEIRYKHTDRASVFSGADRWGGDGIHSEDGRRQVEAAHSDRKLRHYSDGLDVVKVFGAIGLYRAPKVPSRQRDGILYVPYRGDLLDASLRGIGAVHGAETRTYDAHGRILSVAPATGQDRGVKPTPIGDYRTYQGAQYEAIRSISCQIVTDLPVYNLTTASSIYVAAGYLVHNCGTPVIVGDWCAQEDLCWGGWKIHKRDALRFYDQTQGAWVYIPQPAAIAQALEYAYHDIGGAMRAQALAGAEAHQIDRVLATHWLPLLAEVERDVRAVRSRGVVRIVTPQEVLA